MCVKTVLFIVTEINSANGICSKAVMNELSSDGYRVLCLSNEERELPKGHYTKDNIDFYTVKPRLVYRLENYLNTMGNGMKKKLLACFTMLLNKSKLFLSIPSWPLISLLYSYRIYKKAKDLCKTENVDVIIPVYTKVDALIAAEIIKKKMPDIEYCPYFLDSMSGGFGPRMFSKDWVIKRGLKWERRLLKTADKIFLMKSSEEHHQKYSISEDYYKKMVFLDLPLFIPENNEKIEADSEKKDIVELLFIGTIPVQVRSPEQFFKVFKNVKGDNYRLTIVGNNNCPDLISRAVNEDSRINVLPFVSHEKAKDIILSADFLVNFGNNDISMTPSKIFEYMSTGKPVISTAPIKDEPGAKYLEKYPVCCILNEYCDTPEEMSEKLSLFLHEAHGKTVDTSSLKNEFYLNTPQAFTEQI